MAYMSSKQYFTQSQVLLIKAGDETCNHLRFFNYIHEGSDWLGNNIAECASAKTLNKTSVNLIKIFNLFSPSQDDARCGVL